jgi:two-component system, NarL family, response regulator
MDQNRIRVLCVDDHPVVRAGVVAILSGDPHIEVVATAASGEEAFNLFREHRPDVVVLDLKMAAMSGVDTVHAIRNLYPDARIVVLTMYEGDEDIYKALQAGAMTYLLKDTVADELIQVVRQVHLGQRPIPPAIAERLAARLSQPDLTRRELEVLAHVAKGSRNKEIAGDLGISEETVQVHVRNILSKLNVHDRTEAVTNAFKRGILHVD